MRILQEIYPFCAFAVKQGQLVMNLSHFPLNDALCLQSLLKVIPLGLAVEIGAWTGRSTCLIGHYVKKAGGKFFTIDNFKGSPGSPQVEHDFGDNVRQTLDYNTKRLGVDVEILDGYSDSFVKDFKDESIDFMFIDADHTYTQFKKDFENWYPKIKKGGIFSGHDYNGKDYDERFVEEDCVGGVHHGISKVLKDWDVMTSPGSSIWVIHK